MKRTPNPAQIHLSNAHQAGYPLLVYNPQSYPNSPLLYPPKDLKVLVGIAHLIAWGSIMTKLSNAHPTILPTPDLVGIDHLIARGSIMIKLSNAHPTILPKF
ncbi:MULTISPECIES: hypothetical protein [Moorena]|uniref:Uncharacterized protein n=1 Tax=Moorena producens (strain JHB) TaxID=1454205 RepID=A0A1D9G4L9_MOOP1|nr:MULTISPECIES: hypothetical protein [Moorena]AOY82533.1 hypothetical protein BJP36_24080 [Moorena producens JHB]NEP35353.1 hypothetical protein [Moorena sp. SIO3B2]NEQ10940.1 hypothetical protein [Moorena sp. SIO4E2]NET63592.1 hypothetical protein [Moorena sp. SIO1G6]